VLFIHNEWDLIVLVVLVHDCTVHAVLEVCHLLQQLKAAKLPFRELDFLVRAIGECRCCFVFLLLF
jgi:hypothetical protein